MRQPQLGAGWMPMSAPAPSRRRIPRPVIVLGALFTAALLTGVLRAPFGWAAVILAFITWQLLENAHASGHTFRALKEYAVVFALAWILAGANLAGPSIDVTAEAQARAPSKVEAQTKVQEFRQSISDFIERATAPDGAQTPGPKKERHR